MGNKKNDIDSLFSEKLLKFSEKPSDNVWNDIKEELIFGIRQKRISRYKWIAACLVILFASFILFLFIPEKNIEKKFAENKIENILPEKNIEKNFAETKIEKKLLEKNNVVDKHEIKKESENFENIKQQLPEKDIAVAEEIIPSNKKNIAIIKKDEESKISNHLRLSNIEALPKQIFALNISNNSNSIQISQLNKRAEYIIYDFISDDIMIDKKQIIRWALEGDFTSGYSFRDIELNDVSYSSVALKQEFDEFEKGMYAYSYGMKLRYNTKSNFSFLSGLNFSSFGQQNDKIVSYESPDNSINIRSSIGNIKISNQRNNIINSAKVNTDTLIDGTNYRYLSDLGLTQKLKYIEIPFEVKYKFIDNIFKFNIIGGISTGILIKDQTYLNSEDDKIELDGISGLKSLVYNGIFGLGLEYDVTRQMAFKLEPSFKYYLSAINKNTIIKYNPYIFNCSFGISYSFK